MANSGWTVDPNSITLPPGAGDSDPRIYIGPDDPLATALGQDAAIVFYFGNGRAFLITVETSGPDVGQLHVYSIDEINGVRQFMDFTDDVVGNDTYLHIGQNITGDLILESGPTADIRVNSPILFTDTMTIQQTETFVDDDGITYLKGQQGSVSFTFVTLSQSTSAVVFPIAFRTGEVPKVTVNIDSGAGATAGWVARAIAITETGFTVFVFNTRSDPAAAVFTPLAVSWTNIPVSWTATVPG